MSSRISNQTVIYNDTQTVTYKGKLSKNQRLDQQGCITYSDGVNLKVLWGDKRPERHAFRLDLGSKEQMSLIDDGLMIEYKPNYSFCLDILAQVILQITFWLMILNVVALDITDKHFKSKEYKLKIKNYNLKLNLIDAGCMMVALLFFIISQCISCCSKNSNYLKNISNIE